MLNFSFNSLIYKLFGGVAILALGVAGCEQPQAVPAPTTAAPTAQMQPDRYYLNATASTKEAVEQLDPKTIVNIEVLKGQQAADYAHSASVNGVILVRTR